MIGHVRDASNRDQNGGTIVHGGQEPGISAAAAATSHSDALRVYFGPCLQVIQRAHRVPGLDASRRIPPCRPPPHATPMRAVVFAFELSHLQRVNDKRHVPVLGQPGGMMTIANLCYVGHSVLDCLQMTTQVKNRWSRAV